MYNWVHKKLKIKKLKIINNTSTKSFFMQNVEIQSHFIRRK